MQIENNEINWIFFLCHILHGLLLMVYTTVSSVQK